MIDLMNSTLFVKFTCYAALLSSIKLISCRDWDRTTILCQKISKDYATMDKDDLFYHLYQLRRTVGWASMADLIPVNFTYDQKELLGPVLALSRVLYISYDKCEQPLLSTNNGNVHRKDYIGLVPIVKRKLTESEALLGIIDEYHHYQLILCKNALNGQINNNLLRKSKYLRRDFDNFKVLLLQSFEYISQIDQISKQDLLLGIARFLVTRLNQSTMYQLGTTWPALAEEFKIRLITNCRRYFLEPYKTIMETYEAIGRSNESLVGQNHNQLIRAYDLCMKFNTIHRRIDMPELMRIIRIMNNK